MHCQVNEMPEEQIIEPPKSPWSSPVVLVAKPDGTQCFCVDYQALNMVTKRDLYPLPWCDDILESLAGAQWFSHLDLLCGYWQIDVAEEDREKTAFRDHSTKFALTTDSIFRGFPDNFLLDHGLTI